MHTFSYFIYGLTNGTYNNRLGERVRTKIQQSYENVRTNILSSCGSVELREAVVDLQAAYVETTQFNNIIKVKSSRMTMRQQPCPYRIVDDFGNGFSLGCAGGIVLYLIRGMWYAPKKEKFMGGIMLLKKRAPILGGNFAIWAGLFSATDCALISLRKKEDSINQIVAGAVTGGLLAFRAGARVAFKNAIFGGMMLGSIVIVEKIMMKMHKKQELEMQKQVLQKRNREERRQLAKMRPDMFEGSGDNLIPRVRRVM